MPAQQHSTLGASGAFRWLPPPHGGGCFGSVGLSYGISEDEDDDTFSKPGTAAHALAASCLTQGNDAWQSIGEQFGGVDVDKEMADAVQMYADVIRYEYPDRHQGNSWIERGFHCPEIHDLCYGTADFVYWDEAARTLHVWDYKHGAGIVVDATNNVQCMYYACGVLEDLDLWLAVDTIVLHICQPRGFHFDGPIREWSIDVSDLEDWMMDVLIPGMENALVSRDTKSGEHCRFCPARLRACPQLMMDMGELWDILETLGVIPGGDQTLEEMEAAVKASLEGRTADKLDTEDLARGLDLLDLTPILKKAYERVAFNRMTQNGVMIENRKLVNKRMNRTMKDGGEKKAVKTFGKKRAFTVSELKSPAEIDKMPGGKAFTAEWAYKPKGDITIAKASDNRRPIEPKDVSKMFKPVKGKK